MNREQATLEALQAIANELARIRLHLEGPSQNGAAFLIPGALVTVTNPRSEWYGATGRVHWVGPASTHVSLPGHRAWFQNHHLKKAEQ